MYKTITSTQSNTGNELNGLKENARKWLDAQFGKNQIMYDRVVRLRDIREMAIANGDQFETEQDVVKHATKTSQEKGYSSEKAMLEVGLCALAWDELNKR